MRHIIKKIKSFFPKTVPEKCIILLGPPGAGKSTQGKLLGKEFNIPWISIGELLREAYKHGLPEGKEWWDNYGSKGLNAPINIKFGILERRLGRAKDGFILDDFPRTQEDLEALKDYLSRSGRVIDKVILIDVPVKTSLKRVLKRWEAGTKRGVARYDDSPYVLKVRIKEGYRKELPPIIDFFTKQNIFVKVSGNGERKIEDIHKEIVNIINKT